MQTIVCTHYIHAPYTSYTQYTQSGKFMSSVGSQRLRRATRSEKMNGNGTNAVADEMQMQLVRRLEHAVRVDAAVLIATFLGDIEKTFKNRILKFRRCDATLPSLLNWQRRQTDM